MIHNILIAPVVSEKSISAQTGRKYTFRVHPAANKIEVAKAVEKFYGVKVDGVNILPIRRKFRLVGRGNERTKRSASKRAIVTLKEKQTIDFNKVKTSK